MFQVENLLAQDQLGLFGSLNLGIYEAFELRDGGFANVAKGLQNDGDMRCWSKEQRDFKGTC